MSPTTRTLRPDVYRVIAAHRVGMGRAGEALVDPLRSKVDALSSSEAAILSACRGPATLDEHADRAVAMRLPGTRATIRSTLSDLAARGALISDADLGRILREGASAESGAAGAGAVGADARDSEGAVVSVLGVPTRDRVEPLRRALDGQAREIAERNRAIEIVIADDGASSEGAREVGRAIVRRFGVRVRLLDRAAKARIAKAIAESGAAPIDAVERAILPEEQGVFSAGANRNALLLAAVGRGMIAVDDDTACDLRAPPDAGSGLVARSFDDPTEMWFDDRAGEAASDLVAAHERLLGRPARAAMIEAMESDGLDLAGASPALLARVARGGRVRCTQLGVHGDSALGTMAPLLTIGTPTRGRLLASEEVYRGAIERRRLLRAVKAPTITELDGCMAFAIGFDARSILPPFPAVERNEDGLFGAALAACDPGALFGHLPLAIAHEPPAFRGASFDAVFDQVGRVGANDVIAGLVSASLTEIDHASLERAIASLGRALVAWTTLPEDELFERLAWMLARRIAQRLARVSALLRESRREPAFWARDLDRLADVLRERAEDPDRAVPYDLVERSDLAAARRAAVRRIRAHAELLVRWPAIWEAARAIHLRGDPVGEALS